MHKTQFPDADLGAGLAPGGDQAARDRVVPEGVRPWKKERC